MSPANVLTALALHHKKYGPIYDIFAFSNRIVVIADVECIHDILLKRPKQYRRTEMMEPVAEAGQMKSSVLFSNGDLWNKLRRVTAPSFNRKCVESMSTCILREVRSLVESLALKCEHESASVNGREVLLGFTANVLCAVAIGTDLTASAKEYCRGSNLLSDLKIMIKLASERSALPIPAWLWKLTPLYYHYELPAREAVGRLRAVCLDIIASFEHKKNSGKERESKSLLETLTILRADGQGKLSEDEVLENIMVYFIAGMDTTSVALSWVVYYLSLHPHVVARIRKEADAFFAALKTKEESLTEENDLSHFLFEKVHSLEYCLAAFKESLRLSSPVSSLFMQSALDHSSTISSSVGEIQINPRDMLLLHIDVLLKDPAIFPEPLTYRPERWIDSSLQEKQNMERVFLNFGLGPRQCPGKYFSNLCFSNIVSVFENYKYLDFQFAL